MTTIQTEYTRDRDGFPTIECSRCGGNGRYSYCERFGNTCMKCGGSGRQLTASAARQRKAWIDACLTKTNVNDIRVGDVVIWHTMGVHARQIVCTVTAIERDADGVTLTFGDRKGAQRSCRFLGAQFGTATIDLYHRVDPAEFVAKCKEVREGKC